MTGHYAPQLADLIHKGNQRGPYINLKGFMVIIINIIFIPPFHLLILAA